MGVEQQRVSRLADFLRFFADKYSEVGDGIPILVGKKYLDQFGAGSPPRILIVPNAKGRLGPAPKLNANYIAGWSQGATVYVRGAEDGTDLGYFDSAEMIAERVMNVLKNTDAGHVELAPGDPRDESPLPVDAYGADVAFAFTYTRPVARDVAVWRAATSARAIPDPDRPAGGNGKTFIVPTSAETPTRP
jgi:hypothetical protein